MGKTHGFFPWEKPSGKNPPTLLSTVPFLAPLLGERHGMGSSSRRSKYKPPHKHAFTLEWEKNRRTSRLET
jgi:hypothetical protein